MPVRRIMVIAPHADFRRSLAFALETEGYVVTSFAALPGAEAARGYDCVVLDHKAVKDHDRLDVLAFCHGAGPIVLLAGRPQAWLVGAVFRLVPAPIIGEALSGAVKAAIGSEPQGATP